MTDSGSTVPSSQQPGEPPPGYARPAPPAPPDAPSEVVPPTEAFAPPGAPDSRPTWIPPAPPPGTPSPTPGWPPAPPAPVPPSPAGWAPGPAYQQGPQWGPAPAAVPAPPAPRARILPDLGAVAPPLLASLALSAGVVLLFFANLLIAIGDTVGTPGNIRLLQFLTPADVAVGAIMILAVALVALVPAAVAASPAVPPAVVRLTAGAVAAFVALAAFVRAITVLTVGHQHGAIKVGNMFDALAAVLVAGVGALWAFRTR